MVNELQNLMYNLSNMMPMLIVVLALGDLAFPEYFAGFEAVTIPWCVWRYFCLWDSILV